MTKTVLITGATDGLGLGVAQRLAEQGHMLLLHGRNQEKLDGVAASLDTIVRTYRGDLASLAEVRQLAERIVAAEPRIDVLLLNAGIAGVQKRLESADGYELNLAVNYLAQFVIVNRLLDTLRASAPARIVLVSSIGQEPIDWDNVMLERDYTARDAYHQSKLAQVAYGFKLARELDPTQVTVTSLHPATRMPTNMVRKSGFDIVDTLERGVAATSRLCVDSELDGVTGVFYDREDQTDPHPWASDPAVQERLWALSEELTA
jgi:NAD(P)-dependent dehydrogenase (short-subunit alcohol dehydrogenase family)